MITGGAGFIGSHIADLLADLGHRVLLLDALLPQAHGGTGAPPWTDRHELVVGDVRDADLLRRLLPDVDAVCHQAAMVGHGVDPSDAPDYAAHNVYGTAVLLAAMHATGVRRLVLAGSMVVYGEGRYDCPVHAAVRPGPRRPADLAAGRFEPPCPRCGAPLVGGVVEEDAPLDPRSTYAASKLAQEHLASAWARQTDGSVWSLRYHNVYGPRMPRDTPYAGVASIFRSALARGEAPRVLEDGRQRRDFVHVSDVAEANGLALLGEPPGPFTAVNVCSGEPHTVGELAGTLAAAMGGPEPLVVGGARAGDVRHVVASPTRARELLGFRARKRFADGVAAFATDPLRDPVPEFGQGTPRARPKVPSVAAGGLGADVVLPCLNEAQALPGVLARLPAGYRAIVVDNGSTDDTVAVATAAGATVVVEPRRGYGAAVHAGVLAATADYVCVLDADGSLPPELLPTLVAELVSGRADLAVGRRRPVGRGAWPWHARLGNALIAGVLRRRGVAVHDIAPVRAFRRAALLDLGVRDRAFGYPLELLLRAGAAGWRVHEMDVEYRPRTGGRSKVSGSVRGTARAVRDMVAVLALTRASTPG